MGGNTGYPAGIWPDGRGDLAEWRTAEQSGVRKAASHAVLAALTYLCCKSGVCVALVRAQALHGQIAHHAVLVLGAVENGFECLGEGHLKVHQLL